MKTFFKQTQIVLGKLYDGLLAGLIYIGIGLTLFMVLCISASVFLRRTEYSFGWGLEASEYILIITTFFATGWLLRSGGHIRVDIVSNFFKGKKQQIYNGIVYVIVALVCLVFTVGGAVTTWEAFVGGTLQIKVYTFPKWILISLVPFGGFFLFVESARLAYRNFRKKSILIVDDETDIVESLEELLKDYNVEKAFDFKTAYEMLERNYYDAVILDIMGVKGFDLLKMSSKKGYATIMLTAHSLNPEALQESLEMGAVAFVPKEEMSNIGLFVDDAIIMTQKDARANFYLRLGSYFEHRFQTDWKQQEGIWAEIRQLRDSGS
jgi:TRAP-type C4-dicarboxylate transport system permease small subunit